MGTVIGLRGSAGAAQAEGGVSCATASQPPRRAVTEKVLRPLPASCLVFKVTAAASHIHEEASSRSDLSR